MKRKQPLVRYGSKRSRRRHTDFSFFGDDMFSPDLQSIDQSQKPTSQKAATMPQEPSNDDVDMLVDITGIPKSFAVRFLKAKHNNLEAATNAVLEGEDVSKLEQATTWDEGVWSAGKDGGNNNDHHLRPFTGSAAVTRPNSPAPSNRSNINPSSKQEEDEDLQRALAMSQGDLGSQQETGRIGANGQQTQFGPATRAQYDTNQWAMVPTGGHQTSEIIPDVEIEHQRHIAGEPRILKHLPSGDYLPNLLTICHAIEGARNAMLMPQHVQRNYGQDSEWWRGHSISMPKVVNLEDGSATEPEPDKYDEVLAEVQRLMAFMSASDRSYASIGALTQLDVLKNGLLQSTRSRTLLELFLEKWVVAASAKSGATGDLNDLFTTTVGTNASEGMDTPDMTLIDMQVTIGEGAKSDLFELLDGLLWDTNAKESIMSDNYIERPADILVMRAHQANPTAAPQLRVEVPAEFYVDKYLPENIEATRAIRAKMADGKKRITKIEGIENKLRTWKHPTKTEQIDAAALIKHTLGHFSGQNRLDVISSDKTMHVPEHMKDNKPEYLEIAEKLEKTIASIDQKLLVLEEEKEKTRKAISEMSKAPPHGLVTDDLKHRYILRGVATKPNITYVLCPTDPDADYEMFEDDNTPMGSQWWRMEYEVNASGLGAKVTKTKTPDYDVIRAVELEHSSALLVYASDDANQMSIDDEDLLPEPLKDFVRKDNQLFAAELQAERNKPPPYNFADEAIPSVERNSMDSTRVEGNVSDDGQPSPDFGNGNYFDHPSFGLGPNIKSGYRGDEDDAPVHEVHLTPPEDEGTDMGMEMTEKPHGALIPGLQAARSDDLMEDVSQDQGAGGSMQIEDTRFK